MTQAQPCRVRETSVVSHAEPPAPTELAAPKPAAAGAAGTPAGPPVPKKPWQLLVPGEPFDAATVPGGRHRTRPGVTQRGCWANRQSYLRGDVQTCVLTISSHQHRPDIEVES